MFRVLLVDDEIAAREALREGASWAELGFELAGETADGELALSMLREVKPDVLITDIRMPYMDGLELCRRALRELPELRVVIVSARADFACAREAMALGVREYLPKPVDAAALSEALARVAAELREERARREREGALRDCMASAGRLMRERLLDDLFGGADAEAVLRSARAMRLNLMAKRYLVLLLRPEAEASERALLAVRDALERLAAQSGDTALLRRSGAEFSLLVLGDGAKHLRTRAAEFAEAACRAVERDAGVRLAFAFGVDVDRLSGVPGSLASARAQLRQYRGRALGETERPARRAERNGEVPSRAEGEAASAPEFDLPPLAERLRGAGPEDVDEILAQRALALGAERSEMFAHYLCAEALLTAIRIARDCGGEIPDAASAALRSRDGAEDLLPLCRDALRQALELRHSRGSGRYGAMLRRARAYIDERFADPNLALRDVAAHVALSNNHFCTVFAREMGVSFGEYLTGLRIRRAEELLRDTNLRTGEIAYAVGYNDPHYFSNLFKKKTGYSPRDFRRKEDIKDSEVSATK